MKLAFPSTDELLVRLSGDVTLVTSTRRLARYLRAAHDARQRAEGKSVWESPDILPWSDWLQRCWEVASLEAGPGRLRGLPGSVLNAHQEQFLWQQVIEATDWDTSLLQLPATARVAREAWHLTRAWDLTLPLPGPMTGGDVSAFLAWARRYEDECRRRGWLDPAGLPEAVVAAIGEGLVPLPARLVLAGFDELTPQQSSLLRTVESAGSAIHLLAAPARGGRVVRVSLASTEDEVRAAALWAGGLLRTGRPGRVGLVAPDLEAVRDRIERIFDDLLVPGAVLKGSLERPYNLSLGRPLSASPPIHVALLILELAGAPLELGRLGSLLRSPFLAGGETEMSRRGLLDARLRRVGEPRVGLPVLRRHARKAGDGDRSHSCPILAERLDRLLAEPDLVRQRRMASRWAEAFARILGLLGWPGERTLGSAEYQAVRAWRELLAGLSSLDVVAGPLAYREALAHLRRMAGETPFQPRSPEVPVQVLGMLEAAGMAFDQVWIMGLEDETWPGAARPNPFLPLDLQRAQGLPHASAGRELRFARRVTERLLASAGEVVVSSPARDGERPLRPSPLIAGIPLASVEELGLPEVQTYARRLQGGAALEPVDTDCGPAMAPAAPVSGGTTVFRDQAACPFRAFAAHRLGAAELEVLKVGLDPRMRGVLVHEALALVWKSLQSHDRLCSLSQPELAALVREAVVDAVEPLARRRPETFTGRFKTLECWRLERLLTDWLAYERRRSPFSVVLCEAEREAFVGGVPVRLRLDRLDRLADGGWAVIDYKTGRAAASQWFGDRPDEPQLPLYAVAGGQRVAAVLFAQLRPGELRFAGISRTPELVPDVRDLAGTPYAADFESWAAMQDAWRQVLERLGEAFRDGHAAVDPKRYPDTCRYCGFGLLCRVHERRRHATLKRGKGDAGGD
jgi:ATP-dependent helicase/nuclease subunit B